MKTMLLGFYLSMDGMSFGTVIMRSEFACQSIIQDVEDGQSVVMTSALGYDSPPLVLAMCVDPEKRTDLP